MLAGLNPRTTPVGAWCDAVWAAYVDFTVAAASAGGEAVGKWCDDEWARITGASDVTELSAPAAKNAEPQPTVSSRPMRFDPPIDPETGQPRRPTAEERRAFALQAAANGNDDVLGSVQSGTRAGAAQKVGR